MEHTVHGQWNSSFDDNCLPQLVYACTLRLDREGQTIHSHPGHAELMLVRAGTGVVSIDGRREQLEAGDFVLCGAGEPHSYQAIGEALMEVVSCGISNLYCRGMEENRFIWHDEQPVVHAGAGSRALDDMMTLLERASATPDASSSEVCSYLTAAVVAEALRVHRAAAERAEQVHYELSARARMYLDRHFLEQLTLDQLARAMGVSKYHLDRVFRSKEGCTPMQYVTRLRMARAQTLLAATDMTVQRIAEQCAYPNYNYFTVLFRRTVGMTPGEYRKTVQGRGIRRN